MSKPELKYPKWQAPLLDLILEFRPTELREKMQKVEAAVFERFQSLSSDNNQNDEREALTDALSTLCALKRDGFEFPDWKDRDSIR